MAEKAELEVKGDPSQGWPRHARFGAEEEEGQPAATEVDLMNFGMRAAPITETVITVTPPLPHSADSGGHRRRANDTQDKDIRTEVPPI